MLTLAYNSRPQQSTGVASPEFVTPERVRSLSVERLVGSPAPEETDGSPRAVREGIRARLRNLNHKVRESLTLALRRYKRNYDARVRPINKDVHAGDWVSIDGHARSNYKLGTRAAGPYKSLLAGDRQVLARGGCCNRQGLSPVFMPLPGLAPVSPYIGLRPGGRRSLPK